MKIKVKLFGIAELPGLSELKKEALLEFNGSTVEELIQHLFSEIEPEKKNIIVSKEEKLSLLIMLSINGVVISGKDRVDTKLKEGDFVEFSLLSG